MIAVGESFCENKNICKLLYTHNETMHLQNLSQIKEQYDAIYDETSSFRESLLVSPYCSKFEKEESPRISIRNASGNSDANLLDYIKPFDSEQLNKTEMKQRARRKIPN